MGIFPEKQHRVRYFLGREEDVSAPEERVSLVVWKVVASVGW